MAQPLVVEESRVMHGSVDDAFQITLPMALPALFRRRYGPIPPIKEVQNQVGEWKRAGQTRTVLLAGGGRMQEELTRVEPPHRFCYVLSDITGPLSPLASRIDGEWLFTSSPEGTRVTWRWAIHSRSRLAAPALAVFAWFWRGYARLALSELSTHIVPSSGSAATGQ